MKHSSAEPLLSCELLRFVREMSPEVSIFQSRFGLECFHVLRKAGAIVIHKHLVCLPQAHCSPDGQRFVWGHRMFLLDRGEVLLVRWGPAGPPDFTRDSTVNPSARETEQ